MTLKDIIESYKRTRGTEIHLPRVRQTVLSRVFLQLTGKSESLEKNGFSILSLSFLKYVCVCLCICVALCMPLHMLGSQRTTCTFSLPCRIKSVSCSCLLSLHAVPRPANIQLADFSSVPQHPRELHFPSQPSLH